jgi:hypothetical protein
MRGAESMQFPIIPNKRKFMDLRANGITSLPLFLITAAVVLSISGELCLSCLFQLLTLL